MATKKSKLGDNFQSLQDLPVPSDIIRSDPMESDNVRSEPIGIVIKRKPGQRRQLGEAPTNRLAIVLYLNEIDYFEKMKQKQGLNRTFGFHKIMAEYMRANPL